MSEEERTYVYGHVFESLTVGLYPNKEEILREYIQNCYDAILEARKNGLHAKKIQVQIDGKNLFIYDDGIGMDGEAIEEYRYFGYSKKRMDSNVGFRGIGKLAGLTVADTMVVVTKKAESKYYYQYTCQASKMIQAVRAAKQKGENIPLNQLIEQYSSIQKLPEDSSNHYTTVQLYGIKDEEGTLTNVKKVITYISQVAPVDFNKIAFKYASDIEAKLKEYIPTYQTVEIEVNGVSVLKPFTDDLPFEQLRLIVVMEKKHSPIAVAWFMSHEKAKQIPPDHPRGLVFRCKGFQVGDEKLVRNRFSEGRSAIAYWFVGEIYILDPGVIPSSSRTDFEDNLSRRKLYFASEEQLIKLLNNIANQRSKESSLQKQVKNAEKIVQTTQKKLANRTIPLEAKRHTVQDLQKVKEQLISKAAQARDDVNKTQAEKIVQTINILTSSIKTGQGTFDVEKELGLKGQGKSVYTTIMREVISWFKDNSPANLDSVVEKIHKTIKKEVK
ncbi:MAG: hypothetical protein K0R31_2177 [Clostridiales bacterium]|nr:hypothetical protein [Clostridiales bacterium]